MIKAVCAILIIASFAYASDVQEMLLEATSAECAKIMEEYGMYVDKYQETEDVALKAEYKSRGEALEVKFALECSPPSDFVVEDEC